MVINKKLFDTLKSENLGSVVLKFNKKMGIKLKGNEVEVIKHIAINNLANLPAIPGGDFIAFCMVKAVADFKGFHMDTADIFPKFTIESEGNELSDSNPKFNALTGKINS